MSNEFDIFLKNRVTECDIIVYSLPYRDGLTATNRLILDSCINSYTLHKLVAVQTGSKLVSHIDNMLKRCCEMLNCKTDIGVSAEFETRYPLYPVPSNIEISSANVSLIAKAFVEAENNLQLIASPLLTSIGKSVGGGNSKFILDTNVEGILKQGFVSVEDGISIGANVEGTNGRGYETIALQVNPSAELESLYYCITNTARTATEISALVLGTEFNYSLGRGYNGVAFRSLVRTTNAEKFMTAQSASSILSTLLGTIAKVIYPEDVKMAFSADASMIVKRKRMLSDMDGSELASFDDMTLEEIDYIIL